MTSSIRKLIGLRIKTFRKKERLNQEAVAEAIGCDVTTLSRYERGEYAPDGEQLVKLAILFKVSPMDFLPGEVEISRQVILDLRAKIVDLAYDIDDPIALQDIVNQASRFRKLLKY
ncbi:helix-turn-helix transcriptional regulator [Pseudomonas syringae]|nr:helix-turn-helix transcriptional regulator [Pseudomonas syringae]